MSPDQILIDRYEAREAAADIAAEICPVRGCAQRLEVCPDSGEIYCPDCAADEAAEIWAAENRSGHIAEIERLTALAAGRDPNAGRLAA